MFLPKSAGPHRRYLSGRYVARRVTRAEFTDLLAQVNTANNSLLLSWRQCQDSMVPVEECTADRDVVDEALDLAVRLFRKELGARSLRAEREAPYTLILPNGIEEYTSAKLGHQVAAYQLLCSRMSAHLGPADPACLSVIPIIQRHLEAWADAVALTNLAVQSRDIARTRLSVALDEWDKALTAVYGLLLARVGKEQARSFFPKESVRKRKDDAELDDPVNDIPLPAPPTGTEVEPAF